MEIDVSEISVFIGFSGYCQYRYTIFRNFSRDMSWGFVPGTPSGIGLVHCCEMVDPELRQPTVGRAEIHRPGCEKMFVFGAGQITLPNQFAAIHLPLWGRRSRRKVGQILFGFADRPGRQLPAFGKSYAGYRCSRTAFDCSGRIEEFLQRSHRHPSSDFASST